MSLFHRIFSKSSMITKKHESAHAFVAEYFGMEVCDVSISSFGFTGYCEFMMSGNAEHDVSVFVAGYVQECIMAGKVPGQQVTGGSNEGDASCIRDIVGRGSEVEARAITQVYDILKANQTGVDDIARQF